MPVDSELSNTQKVLRGIKAFVKTNTHFEIEYDTGEQARLYILNNHVFKYYMSPTGEFLDYPKPHNPEDLARINIKKITDYNNKPFQHSTLEDAPTFYIVHVEKIKIEFSKENGIMRVYDNRTQKEVLNESEPLSYTKYMCTQTLRQHKDEYFFGGGMQNGRFTHKGEAIEIVNTNNWVDGGVTSPCPFYWSTYGYGILRNTWQPGIYDFGLECLEAVTTTHKENYYDAFYFINSEPKDILNDYYELTGQPISMPEYAFYEAHLNTFNRDYWVEVNPGTSGTILFEDGKYYKCYQPNDLGDKVGILESLNGEKNNYQFSARAMIDRYKRHDMPLGWFVPNDGYGSGYGQTESLDGDVENLKKFGDYSRAHGVQLALWTESNLHPKDPEHPKKGERDLNKEVGLAGTMALKCDVAWIGSGYSFGLSAVENAANVFIEEAKHRVRPMIITVDGWGGTQRCAGIWSGDQMGGQWEYIRFHIPTYIGTGLSGQPVLGSDMDGIYGGKNKLVNIRDFQWKTFTPLQLNMDGWGWNQKTPFSFDDEATAINRAYLKIKSVLMPYNYTISHESLHGLPMIRAMFLEFPTENSAYTKDSQYQYMWGPNILVAPIYNDESIKDESLRNGIYLPDPSQVWIDYFTGDKYQGGKIINNVMTPLWKIPVFIKDGAIIPLANPNNNPNEIKRDQRIISLYPNGETSFEIYEDDGISSDYLEGNFATTKITISGPTSNKHGDLLIDINKTTGSYNKMVKERTTIIQIMTSKDADNVKAAINGEPIQISRVETDVDFDNGDNILYFKEDFAVSSYLKEIAGKILNQKFLLIKIGKIDVTSSNIQIKIKGYANEGSVFGNTSNINEAIRAPADLKVVFNKTTPTTITLQWKPEDKAKYYEIERDGVIFTNIIENIATFDGFKYESVHLFRIRTVIEEGISEWSDFITATTKEDPYKNTVKNVKVSCNIPCQPSQEIYNLTDGDSNSIWHTQWCIPCKRDPRDGCLVQLKFDLRDIYKLDKVEYIPRDDAGNGTFLQIQYRFSSDDKDWTQFSDNIIWNHDATPKTIMLNGKKIRFMELNVLDSIGNYGSGRQVLFYKTKNT